MLSALWLLLLGLALGACVQRPSYYSFNGTYNNLDHPDWGSASYPFARLQVPVAAYGPNNSLSGSGRPSAREVSATLRLPSYPVKPASSRNVTGMLTIVGQFLDHDLALSTFGRAAFANISIPVCDTFFDPECIGNRTLRFLRTQSIFDQSGARQQQNQVTSFLDGPRCMAQVKNWQGNYVPGRAGGCSQVELITCCH